MSHELTWLVEDGGVQGASGRGGRSTGRACDPEGEVRWRIATRGDLGHLHRDVAVNAALREVSVDEATISPRPWEVDERAATELVEGRLRYFAIEFRNWMELARGGVSSAATDADSA